MKKYIINWSRNDYGKCYIEAENEQEARDMFETGDYPQENFIVKGGECEQIESITEIK